MGDMNRETMKRILGDKPIGYHPIVAKCLKSATGALFFSQLMYWDSTLKEHRNGWFWKTHDEMTNETGLTRSEQDTARRELKKRGWIQEERKGIPARLWYRIEWDAFFDDVAAYKSEQSPQSSLQDSAIKSDGNQQTITESTTESTTESMVATPPTPLKEEYQQAEPHHILKDVQAQCGHPLTSIVSIDEGTAYCRDCVAGKATADAEFDALPSASDGEPPRAQSAGVATPVEDWREFKRTYLDRVAGVLGHNSPSSGDKAALKRIWQMGATGKWETFLEHIENGGGTEFQKAGANAFWIAGKFDDYRVSGNLQVDRAAQNTADALAAMRAR